MDVVMTISLGWVAIAMAIALTLATMFGVDLPGFALPAGFTLVREGIADPEIPPLPP